MYYFDAYIVYHPYREKNHVSCGQVAAPFHHRKKGYAEKALQWRNVQTHTQSTRSPSARLLCCEMNRSAEKDVALALSLSPTALVQLSTHTEERSAWHKYIQINTYIHSCCVCNLLECSWGLHPQTQPPQPESNLPIALCRRRRRSLSLSHTHPVYPKPPPSSSRE